MALGRCHAQFNGIGFGGCTGAWHAPPIFALIIACHGAALGNFLLSALSSAQPNPALPCFRLQIQVAAEQLQTLGVKIVLVKLGSDGSLLLPGGLIAVRQSI